MSFILASGSASRRAILSSAGLRFEVAPADVDESAIKSGFNGEAGALALHLAEAKALAISARRDGLVLGADQVLAFEEEMSESEVDWQVHVYGNTRHAFTNPAANNAAAGTVYSEVANSRAEVALANFFRELFA